MSRGSALISAILALAGEAAMLSQTLPHDLDARACKCLNWKSIYQSRLVRCRGGLEFFRPGRRNAAHAAAPPMYGGILNATKRVLCDDFFARLNFDDCMSRKPGRDVGTWCYVDAKCKALNGGRRVNGDASWKVCGKGDATLRDRGPEELFNMSVRQDIWFAGLMRIAYPGLRAGEAKLPKADDFFQTIPRVVAAKVKKLGVTNAPFYFDTRDDGGLPAILVHGRRAYKVIQSPTPETGHPRSYSKLICIVNCTE